MCPIRIASECDEHQDKHSIQKYSAKLQTGTHIRVPCIAGGSAFALPVIKIKHSKLKVKFHFLSFHCVLYCKTVYRPFVLSTFYVEYYVMFNCLTSCLHNFTLGYQKRDLDCEICEEGNNGSRASQKILNYAQNFLGMKNKMIIF